MPKNPASSDDSDEMNQALKKIMDAWNTQVIDKYGNKLERMKPEKKIKLFNEIKAF